MSLFTRIDNILFYKLLSTVYRSTPHQQNKDKTTKNESTISHFDSYKIIFLLTFIK